MTEMSGAELKTSLEGLGLPPSFLAQRLNVTMRTIVRWFDGEAVPLKAQEEVTELGLMTLNEMRRMVKAAVADSDGIVQLHTYRTNKEIEDAPITGLPASWHRSLTFRVVEHLRTQGKTVRVEYE